MEDKRTPRPRKPVPKFDVNGKEIPISLARVWSLLIFSTSVATRSHTNRPQAVCSYCNIALRG